MEDVLLDLKAYKDLINEYLNINAYQEIYELKEDIIKKNDIDLINKLVTSMFYLSKYEELIDCCKDFFKNNLESYDILYYEILSCLAINDLYLAISIINKYKLINTDKLNYYREIDGANYINLLAEDENVQRCMALVLFVVNNIGCLNPDKETIAVSFFELIGSLYELGYSMNVVNELTNVGNIIYKI